MNILLITHLYPSYKNETEGEKTFAIHNFFKYINNSHHVKVIRPIAKPKILNRSDNYFYEDFIIDGIEVSNFEHIAIPKLQIPLFYKSKLLNFLGNYKPDIVIVHEHKSIPLGFFISKKFNIPFIIGVHLGNTEVLKNKYMLKLYSKYYNQASLLGYRSDVIKSQLIELFGCKVTDKLFPIYSGIDENFWVYDEIKQNKFDEMDLLSITIVARLTKRKNIDSIINALSLFKHKFICNIIGDGPEHNNLQTLINNYNLQNNIYLLGKKSHKSIKEHLEKSHLFILISTWETFGLVYLEAMSQGNIVIGSKGEGIDGIVEDSKNGFLTEAGNFDNLLIKLENFISLDLQTIHKLSKSSVETAKYYSQLSMSNNYKKYIESIVP
jgi:glycosyltransferase involved in cell wall biosynthesis